MTVALTRLDVGKMQLGNVDDLGPTSQKAAWQTINFPTTPHEVAVRFAKFQTVPLSQSREGYRWHTCISQLQVRVRKFW